MKIRRIDSEGDWDYGHSISSYYIDNAQSVGLNIITRLREWYRDCFFAMTNGIDYPKRLGNYNQKENLDNDIQYVILNSQDVINITHFQSSYDRNTRHYSFEAQVLHVYSTETIPIYFDTEEIL